ncbi:MAG: DUF883 family protein [Pseudohongiella sp.]|nr:DUF883 family protein [Pseudohongiella sp.]MDO9520328.1 DUF883 family protein [Pseudohongiella sp.]MDP2126396.1 DUF883 family protein [Pseudohongiella sp.]
MKKKVEHDASTLSDEFDIFLTDIENLMKEAADLTGEEFSEAKAKINDKIATTRESVASMSNSIGRKARKTVAKANREIHDEPWKAIGGAAAVGLLLGLLVSRRD